MNWKHASTALAALVIAGCSGTESGNAAADSPDSKSSAAVTIALVFDEGGRGDKSFNDSAAAGLDRVKSELKANTKEVDSKTQSDYRANFENLAFEKPDLIIGVGVSMNDAVHDAAKKYPEQKFALIDMPSEQPNVLGVVFKEEEGSYLAGALAGLTTKSNKIGFVGGKSIPLIKKFEAGFIAGVKSVNPNASVTAKYTENWNDVQKGKEAALTLFNGGADIVYHAAGKCGLGVIQAAVDTKKLAIGVDSDQDHVAEGFVLSSMVKRVDRAVFDAATAVKNGQFRGGTVVLGVKEGGVGLSDPKPYTEKLMPEGAWTKVTELKRMIEQGSLVVPSSMEQLATFKPPQL
jgi:basic membrane protein A